MLIFFPWLLLFKVNKALADLLAYNYSQVYFLSFDGVGQVFIV